MCLLLSQRDDSPAHAIGDGITEWTDHFNPDERTGQNAQVHHAMPIRPGAGESGDNGRPVYRKLIQSHKSPFLGKAN